MRRQSPTRYVRTLADSGSRTRVGHVGLAYEKLAPHNSTLSKDAQPAFIRNLVDNSDVPESYGPAFRRWVRRTQEERDGRWGRRVLAVVSQGRVLCGLGALTPTENGLAIHPTFGVPYLPGSSLKGVTRAWVQSVVQAGEWQAPDGPLFREVFGALPDGFEDLGLSGAVGFLDALWIPGEAELPDRPWAAEIVTPHFGGYYKDASAPDGTEAPNPTTFLAAQGGFRIVVEGPQGLLDAVVSILEKALSQGGVGAKSRAGYGRFVRLGEGGLTRQDRFEATARREGEVARALEAAFARAEGPVQILEALLLADPARDIHEDLRDWLTGADRCEAHLAAVERTPDRVGEAWAWGFARGATRGLLKKVRDHLTEAQLAVVKGLIGEDTAAAASGAFGSRHRETFEDPSGLSLKRRKAWPNAFATEIAEGGFDEDTVRRAIAYLKEHGGRPGHVRKIAEAYGLLD